MGRQVCVVLVLLASVALAHPTDYSLADQELTAPTEHSSGDTGTLSATITMDQFRYEGHADTGSFWTRVYNGALPGPTLRFRAGDTVNVQFNNNLGPQPNNNAVHNTFHSPNTTNFHTHGLHVSPISPADSVFITVDPGQSFAYQFEIPSDHAPGLHWYHAHHHSSTALQVGGGASGLLVVEDEEGDVPEVYRTMEEVLLILQEFPMGGPADNGEIAEESGDTLTTVNNQMVANDFILVNGYYQPRVSMVTNKWYRFRVAYSGVFNILELSIAGCEIELLAKDGVYLSDAPRTMNVGMPLAPGNRVDFAVRCTTTGTFTVVSGTGAAKKSSHQKQMGGDGGGGDGGGGGDDVHNLDLLSLVVTANTDAADDDLPSMNFLYPDYIADLTSLPDDVTPNTETNDFQAAGGGCTLNGVAWAEEPEPNYEIEIGTVQEWMLQGIDAHPFHMHVSPFQITQIDTNNYHMVGDWYDVLYTGTFDIGNPQVRFQTDRFTGDYVIHCHLLPHEDEGCMGFAQVSGTEGTPAIIQGTASTLPECQGSAIPLSVIASLATSYEGMTVCV